MLASAATITLTARLLTPLINDLYEGAKKAGVRGLKKWEERTFPRKLARRLRAIEEVKTIWSPDKETTLDEFYYPPRVLFEGKPRLLAKLSDLEGRNVVIEGTVGQGKSILLRHLAMEEILSNEAKRLPVFIELRTLSAKLNLQQAVLKQLSSYDIELDDESLDYLLRSGRLCYLLDGFDELDEGIEKETFIELEFLSQKYPELQIITTSRLNNSIQKSTAFKIVPVAPLTTSDYSPFMAKLKISAVQAALIKEAIRKSPSKLASLITTPLMLTMVIIVYQSENEIPETLPDFFEKLFHVVFTRHDKLKATYERKHHSGLSERRLQTLFEAFCFMAMQNGFTRSLSNDQFSTSFDEALEYVDDCKCEPEKFKLDITKVTCLMLEEGLDTTTFLHKSIMEYYAAAFIKHSSDEVAALFYSEVVENSRSWWEVLSFLKDIDPYRYSRDFSIPEADFVKKLLVEGREKRTDLDMISLLNRIHPGLCIDYGGGDEGSLEPVSFGPFQQELQKAMRDFTNIVLASIESSVPNSMSATGIMETFKNVTIDGKEGAKTYEVPVSSVIKAYGSKYFWEGLDGLLRAIDRQVEESNRVIDQQERRKLIFTKKKKVVH